MVSDKDVTFPGALFIKLKVQNIKISLVGVSMYRIDNGKVFSFGKEIPQADASSFEIIDENYGRDACHVYFQSHRIENIDSGSIEVLADWLIRDKHTAYYWGTSMDCGVEELEVLPHYYLRSSKGAYFQGRLIEGADRHSFEVLDKHYAKDKAAIYYTTDRLTDVDYHSFQALGSNYAMDLNHIYHGRCILSRADRKSFEIIPDQFESYYDYARDDTRVYYEEGEILFADPASFEIIQKAYAKDKNRVYRFGRCIEGADPASFRVLHSETIQEYYLTPYTIAHDVHCVYYDDQKLCKYDPSFRLLGGFYYRLCNQIFHMGCSEPLENVDLESFCPLSASWAKDQNTVYSGNKKVDALDCMSFEVLDNGYAKDKHYVYFFDAPIEGIDAETFELLGGDWARDRHTLLYDGEPLQGSDPSSFRRLHGFYYADDKHVYYLNRYYNIVEVIEHADLETFTAIDRVFAKDARHAFYFGARIEGSDGNTFVPIEYAFSKDANSVYFGCDRLCSTEDDVQILDHDKALVGDIFYYCNQKLQIDRDSFELINNELARDKNQVIFRGEVIAGADPASFEVLNAFFFKDKHAVYFSQHRLDLNPQTVYIEAETYASDGGKVYFTESAIREAHAPTFQALGGNFSKDKQHVYFRESIVEGAEAATFEYLNFSECRDAHYKYFLQHGEVKSEPLDKTKNR